MEHGILAFLQGADKTMAWAAAVALAAGGTALFVAFYLQWQRWRSAARARRDARRGSHPAQAAPARRSVKPAGKPAGAAPRAAAPAAGVAAYRQAAAIPEPAAAVVSPGPVPMPGASATLPAAPAAAPRLDPLLARLQDAGDRLEELMRRHANRSHEQDDLARLAAAIDVEFLHKQA
ncbi:MAG: hypothetical protein Q7W56_08950 [Candidatus Latescibacteria bacterium]|nr:hypothetical protein [Candidatus Latescibacterota bacterium]